MRRFYCEAFNIFVTVLGLIPEAKGITDKSEDSYEIKNLASPSVITAFKNLPTPKYVGAPQERKNGKCYRNLIIWCTDACFGNIVRKLSIVRA